MSNKFGEKINLYMQKYILPVFDPTNLYWVFSLSGGKDSYAMCQGIFDWYQTHRLPIKAAGLHIWQWGENPEGHLHRAFPWLEHIYVKDARSASSILPTAVNLSAPQAPCRYCANIRRNITDTFLCELTHKEPVLLCRGLHLTDMAISLLWRLVWFGPGSRIEEKGKPLTPLPQENCFLSKPLCLVREYECQEFAREHEYTPFFCNCPSTLFPSRRDIVEESIRHYYTNDLWEFSIPGYSDYLQDVLGLEDPSVLINLSLRGHETKSNCIPADYYAFAKNYFLQKVSPSSLRSSAPLLECRISDLLENGRCDSTTQDVWTCRLYSQPDELTDFDLRMIGTMGPFWAAVSLPRAQRNKVFQMQARSWQFDLDIAWNQVCSLLAKYYSSL